MKAKGIIRAFVGWDVPEHTSAGAPSSFRKISPKGPTAVQAVLPQSSLMVLHGKTCLKISLIPGVPLKVSCIAIDRLDLIWGCAN